jgi:hypothetical protein
MTRVGAMSNRLRGVVIAVVTGVWAVNMIAPIFIKEYVPSPELNVAFMAIIGILTASYKKEKDENGGNGSKNDNT